MTTVTDQPAPTTTPQLPDFAGPTWEEFRSLEHRLERQEIGHNTRTMFVWAFAVIAVVLSVIAIGFGSRAISESKRNVRAASAAPATASASPGPVTLREFQLEPAAVTVAAGTVTFQIANAGKVPHELLVFRSDLAPNAYPMINGNINEDGPGIAKVSDGDNLAPGASQTRSVDLRTPGTYLFVCNLPGHFAAGMYRVITVK